MEDSRRCVLNRLLQTLVSDAYGTVSRILEQLISHEIVTEDKVKEITERFSCEDDQMREVLRFVQSIPGAYEPLCKALEDVMHNSGAVGQLREGLLHTEDEHKANCVPQAKTSGLLHTEDEHKANCVPQAKKKAMRRRRVSFVDVDPDIQQHVPEDSGILMREPSSSYRQGRKGSGALNIRLPSRRSSSDLTGWIVDSQEVIPGRLKQLRSFVVIQGAQNEVTAAKDAELSKQAVCLMETSAMLVITGCDEGMRSKVANQVQGHYALQGYNPLTVHSLSDWEVIGEGKGRHCVVLFDDVLGGDVLDDRWYPGWRQVFLSLSDCIIQQHVLVIVTLSLSAHREVASRGDAALFENMNTLDTDVRPAKTKAAATDEQVVQAAGKRERSDSTNPGPLDAAEPSILDRRRLHLACQKGDSEEVDKLLKTRVNVNARDVAGWSPLHHASHNGHADVVQTLLAASADVTIRDKDGRTALHLACLSGQNAVVQILAQPQPQAEASHQPSLTYDRDDNADAGERRFIDEENASGQTALHLACASGNARIAALLLKLGADVKKRDKDKNTALHSACQHGHSAAVHALLYDNSFSSAGEAQDNLTGALWKRATNIDVIGCRGDTPIHVACQTGQLLACWELVQCGASLSCPNADGDTPFILACRGGFSTLVRTLLLFCKDVNEKNRSGSAALHEAITHGHIGLVHLLLDTNFETDNALLQKEFNLNAKDSRGRTPLFLAAECGHASIVKALLQRKALSSATDMFKETALHAACRTLHTDIVEELLAEDELAGLVNAKNEANQTPLHLASRFGHLDTVITLLKAKADVNAREKENCTALYSACTNGYFNIAGVLLQHDAEVNALTSSGKSALQAACFNGYANIAKLLIEHNADMTIRDSSGFPLLYIACGEGHEGVTHVLLAHGANVDETFDQGWTALLEASLRGNTSLARLLLDHDASVNLRDQRLWTALQVASNKGNVDVVNLLLERGAAVDGQTVEGWTALHMASKRGHLRVVQLLLENAASVELVDANGHTALHYSCSSGCINVTETLLKYNACRTAQDADGNSPLHQASLKGFADTVQLLLMGGADVNLHNKDGWTALQIASSEGHLDVVKLLVGGKACVSLTNKEGDTALHTASYKGHVDIVQLLLEHDAFVNAANKKGFTSLHMSSQAGHKDLVEALLRYGADVNLQSQNGSSALHRACAKGYASVVDVLLKAKADVNVKDKHGETPLIAACNAGHEEVVSSLLQTEVVEVNAANDEKQTALHVACSNGHNSFVRLLLNHGAAVNARDSELRTPIHAACQTGHDHLVDMLVNHGADPSLQTTLELTAADEAERHDHFELAAKLRNLQRSQPAAVKSTPRRK